MIVGHAKPGGAGTTTNVQVLIPPALYVVPTSRQSSCRPSQLPQPAQPSVSRSASSADPSPVPANQPSANRSTSTLARSLYGHPDSGSQWVIQVENELQGSGMNPPALFVDDHVVSDQQNALPMRGTITHLPLYGNVVERYLTEV